MSVEELSKIENFDLKRYNTDPAYRKYVDDARRIKANAEEVIRDQAKTKQPYDINKDPRFTKVQEQEQPQVTVVEKRPATTDFTFQDFAEIQKSDANSPISKAMQREKGVLANSMWTDRANLKKYWAAKKHIRIKVANEERFNTYTFQSVTDEQLKQLQQMNEDLKNFYGLVAFEKHTYEDIDGIKRPALYRNGRYYTKIADLESDYRKNIAFTCLGINEDEFSTLEQFSDPDYTVRDIWGLYDLIDGIYERAARGGSYFLIAFKL